MPLAKRQSAHEGILPKQSESVVLATIVWIFEEITFAGMIK
jgi:hypothetical protein